MTELKNPRVVITLTDQRKIRLELFPAIAPITTKNFIELVEAKYYDGLCFHRIIDHFMIQMGAYYVYNDNTIRIKDNVPTIVGEFDRNGYDNPLKHELGIISMARAQDNNSASSQFFICAASTPHLDGYYAAFGRTIDDESTQVVLQLAKAPVCYMSDSLANFPRPHISVETIKIE